jgi:DNA-binding NarL/FixJ family response regulator
MKARTMLRIFIVEDHPTYREILVDSLKDVAGAEVSGTSATAESALEALPGTRTDVVLVDVSLPKMSGFEFAIEIRKRYPGLACLMLSGFQDRALVERARSLGLAGYVVKGDLDELRKAVTSIMAGKSYFARLEIQQRETEPSLRKAHRRNR